MQSCTSPVWHSYNQRNTDSSLVKPSFAGAQWEVTSRAYTLLGGETAIVREEENIRVFQNALRSQVRNKRPDRIIDRLDHGREGRVVLTRPAPAIMLPDCYWRGAELCGFIPVMGMIFVLWNDWGVDVVIREEGKERRILAFGDELFCLTGEVNCAVFPASGSAIPRRPLEGFSWGS